MSVNRVILTGHLGKDVELRYTQSGKAVASFSLAVKDNFTKEKTHWINCTVWGKPAENCANYIGKGSHVAVDGRLNTRSYENNSGQKVNVTEVIAESVHFLDAKKNGGQQTQQNNDPDGWEELGREVGHDDNW